MAEKQIKVRPVQCYDCSKPFDRQNLRRMRGGDMLLCRDCVYRRNMRVAKAKKQAKLKKRVIV